MHAIERVVGTLLLQVMEMLQKDLEVLACHFQKAYLATFWKLFRASFVHSLCRAKLCVRICEVV